MRWFLLLGLLVLLPLSCGSDDAGGTDLYFAKNDTVRLPEGDATGEPGDDATDLPGGEVAGGELTSEDGSCLPQCDNKTCGPDGCGGECGTCKAPDVCLNGRCICNPDCAGKECGNDGCGGSCGKCIAPESCSALGQCENLSCKIQGTLQCNASVEGSTVGLANGFSSYGCGFDASGPEALYQFASDTEVYVQIDMAEPGAGKHNAYVIKGDCNPNVCVTNDFDSVHWTAKPGVTYIYSVDGYQGASGAFTLTVTCIESAGCPDGKIPACTKGQCQYGHWLGDGICTAAFDCADMGFDNGDCK
jgi:hypothetical protein